MKNKIIKILILLYCFLISSHVFAETREAKVAIVGNSQAALMQYFLGIYDNELTYNGNRYDFSIGGAKIWDNNKVNNFPEQSRNYDVCLLWFGTNEYIQNKNECLPEYIDSLRLYLNRILKSNPSIKILMMEIPNKYEGATSQDRINIDFWNKSVKQLCDTYTNVDFYKLPKGWALLEHLHLDSVTFLAIWAELKQHYGVKYKADFENNIERLVITERAWLNFVRGIK